MVMAFENLPYMQHMILFSLATGLRQNNVLQLKWEQIDLKKRIAWIYPDETKNSQALGVPLNQLALQVLAARQKTMPFVFTNSKGQPVKAISHRIWKNGLKRAGITNSMARLAPHLGKLADTTGNTDCRFERNGRLGKFGDGAEIRPLVIATFAVSRRQFDAGF